MWDAFVGFMINVLLYIYSMVGQNFGIAIILFTLLVRLVTHPLTVKQLKGSTAMAEMQKDKRWIEAQKKYKNDKEKLSQEQMRLYKELGVNPFASCLPTLIQLPIIIGLYQAVIQTLASTPFDLVQLTNKVYSGFLNMSQLIPLNNRFLWMDMGKPDLLYIPGLSFPIPILAVFVVITTYIQSKMTTPPPSGPNDQSAQMTGMMTIYMPLMMGYLAFTLASGLSLYFVASNVIGILQYALLGKANWSNLLPSKKTASS
ncbi:MAG: YidC/Oxa1 family membrane protein insertase [Leptolinea sp.]|nr:YidC/Oxa1 family membrane protein insertase [Leptolinea sp.]